MPRLTKASKLYSYNTQSLYICSPVAPVCTQTPGPHRKTSSILHAGPRCTWPKITCIHRRYVLHTLDVYIRVYLG